MKRYPFMVALLAAGVTTAFAQVPQRTEIPFEKLNNNSVIIIGCLGKPLGTKLKISGKQPDKPGKTVNLLLVTAIDGKPLKEPLGVEVQGEKLKPGIEYTLDGYETGAFGNVPEWGDAQGRGNPLNFCFTTWFVVVKIAVDSTLAQ